MFYLSIMTLVWAFSFSLIGVYIAGQVDSYFAVLMRLSLAMLIFLPFLKPTKIKATLAAKLMALGAIQLGIMYCFFYRSFLLISVPEVLLFTVFTPIYVTLLYDILQKRFSAWYLVTAVIAVLGAIVIKYAQINSDFLLGFLVVQGANICFAIGQVGYKWVMEHEKLEIPQRAIFGWFYIGAFIVALIAFILLGNSERMPTTSTQWGVLTYLGIVASGLGYFVWNYGACRVNAGALAIMNNALVPAGLIVNIAIWNRDVDYVRLTIGGVIILLSLIVNETWVKHKVQKQFA